MRRGLSLFFFNDTATTEIYTLSLHDALPICVDCVRALRIAAHRSRAGLLPHIGLAGRRILGPDRLAVEILDRRSEEHTSELQSRQYLVCRLLLEKKTHTVPPGLLFSSSRTHQ